LTVAQEAGVVVEPDEAKRILLREGQVQEREDERGDDRDRRECQEADDPGRDVEQALARLAAGEGRHPRPAEPSEPAQAVRKAGAARGEDCRNLVQNGGSYSTEG